MRSFSTMITTLVIARPEGSIIREALIALVAANEGTALSSATAT
jgi:hypothetical protein